MKTVTFGLFLILFLLVSCATSGTSSETARDQNISKVIKETVKASWEEKWERTLEAARKEGKAVIYVATPAPALKEGLSSFKQKFGFGYEVITGRGVELRGRLLQERANGLFIADVFISGLGTIFQTIKPSGMIDPIEPELILPDVLEQKVWFGEKLPWADEDRLIIYFLLYPSAMLAVNTILVSPADINSYSDLLNPKWKGKIIINDPTVPGAGSSGFANLLYYKLASVDFFHQLVAQQPVIMRDQRLGVDWLARGKYSIAIWPATEYLSEYMNAGAPVAFLIPKEGTYLSVDGSGVALLKRRPHPNATRVFINWLLSREGQLLVQNFLKTHSARVDIPADNINQFREPGKKYFVGVMSIEEWASKEQDRYLEISREIFKPLMER